jgi:hypothetical protein
MKKFIIALLLVLGAFNHQTYAMDFDKKPSNSLRWLGGLSLAGGLASGAHQWHSQDFSKLHTLFTGACFVTSALSFVADRAVKSNWNRRNRDFPGLKYMPVPRRTMPERPTDDWFQKQNKQWTIIGAPGTDISLTLIGNDIASCTLSKPTCTESKELFIKTAAQQFSYPVSELQLTNAAYYFHNESGILHGRRTNAFDYLIPVEPTARLEI